MPNTTNTTTTTSPILNLDLKDVAKGLLVAVISAVLTLIDNSVEAGNFNFNWTNIWHVALLAGVGYLIKNLFTPTQTVVKILLLLCFIGMVSARVSAQSITSPVPKVNLLADAPDSELNAVRPVVAAAYAYPGNLLMAGTGLGYKRLKWDYTDQKWKSLYSLNGILWAAGTTAPGPQVPAFSFGPAVGILNDNVLVGGAYDFTNGRWLLALSLSVPLNN